MGASVRESRSIKRDVKTNASPATVSTREMVLHGAASALIADGATPAVVQKQLRHSDARITLGVYAHVIGNQQCDAVENRSVRIEKYAMK